MVLGALYWKIEDDNFVIFAESIYGTSGVLMALMSVAA